MKVTLSFNGTKIVVPCGAGDISVRELTGLAVSRYKRAIGKHVAAGAVSAQDYWVSVHSLRYLLSIDMRYLATILMSIVDDIKMEVKLEQL